MVHVDIWLLEADHVVYVFSFASMCFLFTMMMYQNIQVSVLVVYHDDEHEVNPGNTQEVEVYICLVR